MLDQLRLAWAYRYFILSSIRNELTLQFARSRLGGTWMIIQPLVMVTIYAVILSAVLRAKLPGLEGSKYGYAIYLISGIICWTLFSDVLTRCLTLFIDNGNLMKKIVFPKICLPLIAIGTALVNNIFLILASIAIYLLIGHEITGQFVLLPLLVLMTLGIGAGFGLILGVLNVFMRDLGQAVPLLLQVGFWFTPIVYPESIVPDQVQSLLFLNPVYPLVDAYHAVLAFGGSPDWSALGVVASGIILLLSIGLWMFRQASPEMVDVL